MLPSSMLRQGLVLTTSVLLSAAVFAQGGSKPKDGKSEPKSQEKENPLDAPDVADIPTQDLRVGSDENQRYLLAGPRKDDKQPSGGFALLVVLPGGDGSASFHPFVKRILKNALPDGYLVAQPVAPKWTKDQQIVWPTEKLKTPQMKFTTEEFVEHVIAEVSKAKKIDPKRIFTLSWSSGGPAAYVLSTRKNTLVSGSLVAMSVFHPDEMDLDQAKGRAYYLLHSPDDKTCPFKMAEQARDTLKKRGAEVELATYDGGHGWKGDVFGNIRSGIGWLEKKAKH